MDALGIALTMCMLFYIGLPKIFNSDVHDKPDFLISRGEDMIAIHQRNIPVLVDRKTSS